MKTLSIVVLLMFVVSSAQAQQEPIVADRPGFADGASVVGKAVAQLEIGVAADRADESQITLPTLIRFGMTDALELRLESHVAGLSDGSSSFAPFAMGFKMRVREGAIPLAVLASVQPPSGEGSLRTREFEGAVRLVSDVDLGNDFALTPNVGVALVEGEGASAIFAASVEKGGLSFTPFVDFEASVGDDGTSMIVDAGLAWLSGNDTQLDVSGGFGVTGDAYPDWFIAAGFSRRF